eukprot:3741337-Pyramimonas_sp.AAC.1
MQFLITIHPTMVEVMQILVGLLSIDGYPKQVATHPMLSIIRSGGTPNTYGTENFTASEKTFLDLT